MGFLKILKKPMGSNDVNIKATKTTESTAFYGNDVIAFDTLKSVQPFVKLFRNLQNVIYFDDICTLDGSECHLIIKGNSVVINGEVVINSLVDLNVFLNLDSNSVTFEDMAVTYTNCQKLYNTVLVSNFESISAQKYLTGILISKFGLQLNDIHILLNSKNKFNYKDWCYIKLNGSNEYIKCWCHIDRDSNDERNGIKIKFYQEDKKSLKKNNLIGFVDNLNVTDLFLNVSESNLEDDNATKYIESIDSVKILGTFKIVNSGSESISRSSTSSSLNSDNVGNENPAEKLHKRNISMVSAITQTSKNSFASKNSLSNLSISSSIQTEKINKKKIDLNLINYKDGLIIKPIPHDGISHMDSLLRMLIPMIDCLKKYGRPDKFKIDKSDRESIMFALPSPNSTRIVDAVLQEKFFNDFTLIDDNQNNSTAQISMNSVSDLLVDNI
ncbi:hypothetical protein TPHA_0J03170 [Tetrapisispora phaffii CBS 4417]|uniref:Skg3/CAF120-like PH-like domain-containing protein n=1 Tax=Tetrapisispora phaffii (strain ATCC 24235 / CBS 4417 / NBRC 1672 / NRRL Y-8282 / UCD 70-5) TaxID=1071381 RepID=G8BY85_TETPH|nr:hypothetical protein TPHA_0J03170 [Tetrapisispora phaffii CBS 4417]CCE65136.1 hypothetical protein TPHA_0J03170 [Tetrapisispora phaffii CBS 4417]